MTVKIDQPAEVGEYDESLQALLQLVWGDGFLSPGGPEEIARILEGTDRRGRRVLDIGGGVGAVDGVLVERHGAAQGTGIDLEPDLIAKARARAARAGCAARIDTIQVTPGPLPFADESFDVAFSKDSIVQIPDKCSIFREMHRVLRPGGDLIVSDWLRGGDGPYSPEMLEYFRLEGITYNMASPDETRAALTAAGFLGISVHDRSDWYRDLARRELEAMAGPWLPRLIETLGRERAEHFVMNWRQLVLVLDRGELRPTHLKARKPGT